MEKGARFYSVLLVLDFLTNRPQTIPIGLTDNNQLLNKTKELKDPKKHTPVYINGAEVKQVKSPGNQTHKEPVVDIVHVYSD